MIFIIKLLTFILTIIGNMLKLLQIRSYFSIKMAINSIKSKKTMKNDLKH